MPRLSEALFKSGGARNAKVNLKKFDNYALTLRNNRILQPNLLANKVSQQKRKDSEAACKEQKLIMMTCWKKHDFRENTCDDEYKAFAKCVSDVRIQKLKQLEFASSSELGKTSENGKLNPRQTNRLLKMYPQPPYRIEITKFLTKPLKHKILFDGEILEKSQQNVPQPLKSRKSKMNRNI